MKKWKKPECKDLSIIYTEDKGGIPSTTHCCKLCGKEAEYKQVEGKNKYIPYCSSCNVEGNSYFNASACSAS